MKERDINKSNYFETISDLGLDNLPAVLKQSHKVISEVTANGTDWSKYNTEPDFKRMMDLTCVKLQQYIDAGQEMSGVSAEKSESNNPYQNIGKEVSIIRRILELNGKLLYKNTLEILIDELQDAFENKEITKKSPVGKDMSKLEKFLVSTFNNTTNAKYLHLKPSTIKRYNSIIEKYENSYNDIDPDYARSKKKSIQLKGLNGLKDSDILQSTELVKLDFPTLGFEGKWLVLIGDPCPGFKLAIKGKPKVGKSCLSMDFAGYLARKHGKVLYVSKEEYLSSTLGNRIKDRDAAHENLDIVGSIPKDLSPYQFIFLDSVTSLKLTPDDLVKLEKTNPGKSFIYVFQVTKDGKARGTNEFMHNVDAIIEIPEVGKAVQYGRFNQGGEMNIFEDTIQNSNTNEASLNGLGTPKPLASHYIDFSISSRTHKPEQLVERYMRFLSTVYKTCRIEKEYKELVWMVNDANENKEELDSVLETVLEEAIIPLLEKIAPKGCYFGAHSGDGADFGFWKYEDKELDGTGKKKVKKNSLPEWVTDKKLNTKDRELLERIYIKYTAGEFEEAMHLATWEGDTYIREQIPPDIWKKMGGKLTPSGEAKLKQNQKKNQKSKTSNSALKERLRDLDYSDEFHDLKMLHEDNIGRKFTDDEFNEIFSIALERNNSLIKNSEKLQHNLMGFLMTMDEASTEFFSRQENTTKNKYFQKQKNNK